MARALLVIHIPAFRSIFFFTKKDTCSSQGYLNNYLCTCFINKDTIIQIKTTAEKIFLQFSERSLVLYLFF